MSYKWMRTPPKPLTPLRGSAEARLARSPPDQLPVPTADALLHELQVHQVELEMQNNELRRTQIELEKSRDRYRDLYEFAPVGYLTLSDAGLITEINLAGAALLGVERRELLNRRPDAFVVAKDRERWQRQFVLAMAHDGSLAFDLAFRRRDGTACDAHVDCLRTDNGEDPPTLRVTLTDISARRKAEQ